MITEIETLKRHAFIYPLGNDFVIIAGRTSKDNDFISLKVAGQNDWWFHVKGCPGSHVLLRSLGNTEPDRKTLEVAAAVAAYYSKARNAGVVPVSCTLVKYVSKPSGVPAGTVTIKKEQTIKVRPSLPDKNFDMGK
ncbi:MAG: hypothetical protein Kow0029_15670 [Candidatus Rifleibacteriota bacterium]